MSSDGYFEGEEDFNSAFLDAVEEIELTATQASAPKPAASAPSARPPSKPAPQPPAPAEDNYSDGFDIDFNDDDIEMLDGHIEDVFAGKAAPVAGPSKCMNQRTLDGGILSPSKQKTFRTIAKPASLAEPAPRKSKKWDHTAFSQSGTRRAKEKGKGKGAFTPQNEDEEEDETPEFEQFPAPFISAMKLQPDLLAARNWLYPNNMERRDYQFNVVKKCLFNNTLVALPTGLGKTFIAGVVMLNYYKWFPDGKIVFVAPTKPLVAQQKVACHEYCGIPSSAAVEMTGDIPRAKRARYWGDKRVFYMTPQTLDNDLASGNCNPLDIILVVIDEAHRGTGDYAYAKIVRFMMSKNPHFRVMALTATPGSNPEAVQSVVDSLHISHIEIRDERSIEIARYIKTKKIVKHVIEMNDIIVKIRAPLLKLMEKDFNMMKSLGLMFAQSLVKLKPYTCQAAMTSINNRPDKRQLGNAYQPLARLRGLAYVLGYLMEFSIQMAYIKLKELSEGAAEESSSAKSSRQKLINDPNYKKTMLEFETSRVNGAFPQHPKMDKLVALVLEHFTPQDGSEGRDTKIMIFVEFRQCVDEVVAFLNTHQPMIRATRFIGQGTDVRGNKGINQAEQIQTIKKFKSGEYNCLVSTSIGEEGLDIGEIDRIVCYDSSKSAIRMLQRVGRTGRKRDGFVDILLAEEREEKNWDKSMENYGDVQYCITKGDQLELYDDVERLIPDHIKPEYLEWHIEPEPPQLAEPEPEPAPKGKKRKKKVDVDHNRPLEAFDGFVKASELRPKAPAKKKIKLKAPDPKEIEDDDDDRMIQAGLHTPPQASSSKPIKSRAKPKKSAQKKNAPLTLPSASQLRKEVEDDSDDEAIQRGLGLSPKLSPAPARRRRLSPSISPARPPPATEAVIELSSSPSPSPSSPKHKPQAIASDVESIRERSLSPQPKSRSLHARSRPDTHAPSPERRKPGVAWLLSSDSEDETRPSPVALRQSKAPARLPVPQGSRVLKTLENAAPTPSAGHASRTKQKTQIEHVEEAKHSSPQQQSTPELPEPTHPVRAPGKARRRLVPTTPPSSPAVSIMEDQRVPPRASRPPKKKAISNPKAMEWADVEAIHSGEEVSSGDSDVEMVESESDRQFLQEMLETQASPSYNQTAAYRMGLMTQAPAAGSGLLFRNQPKRVGPFAAGNNPAAARRPILLSSPVRQDDATDEYDFGSFVVHDEETLLYASSEAD